MNRTEQLTSILLRPIQHAEYFQNITVRPIGLECVSRSIKAKDQLPWSIVATNT